jgi:hypothetical protein
VIRVRAGVAPAAAGLESSRYWTDWDFAWAISDPESSPRPNRDVSGSGPLRGLCDTRSGSIEARTSSVAVQRGGPTSHGALGLRLGLCARPWRVAAHFRGTAARHKIANLQVFPAMARPGLEPGTPRFSAVVSSRRSYWASPGRRSHSRRGARCPPRAGRRGRTRPRVPQPHAEAELEPYRPPAVAGMKLDSAGAAAALRQKQREGRKRRAAPRPNADSEE